MAKSPLNTALGQVRGKIDVWVYRSLEGDTVIARRPRAREDNPTDSQKGTRERFRRAAQYAKAIFADPVRKADYLALALRRGIPASRLFAFIVQDYATPPVITEINLIDYHRQIGDPIKVFASDDGEIVSVTVKLKAPDGSVLEEGPALFVDAFYRYIATTDLTAQSAVSVEAIAIDRPDNRTTKVVAAP